MKSISIVVLFAACVLWLLGYNVQVRRREIEQMRKLQPLLGVVYRR